MSDQQQQKSKNVLNTSSLLTTNTSSVQVLKHLVAGGVAGAVSRTCVSPLERMKILFQLQRIGSNGPQYTSISQCLYDLGRKEGIMGFFKGNGTNVIRIIPYSAVQFAAYERFKKIFGKNGSLDTLGRLVAGASAGIISVISTYPLDLIRTRLSAHHEGAPRYTGISHAFMTILREDGFRALYGGMPATIYGVAPYVGLNFTCYEGMKLFLSKDNELSVPWKLSCGAVAGATAQTLTYPLDLVRRRMQMVGVSGHTVYSSTRNAFVTIARTEGLRGFFKGMLPNYLKVVPSISISFVMYEQAKAILG